MELVSIIIPVYNVEKYIDKCIESICAQSYSNLEIILIDDGSSDCSGEICERWALKDKRIKVLHKINEGVAIARNQGLKIAIGNYIVFIDGDDYALSCYVEQMLLKMKENKVELVIADYFTDTNGFMSTFSTSSGVSEIKNRDETLNGLYGDKGYHGYLWNKMFCKNIIDRNNIHFLPGIVIWEDTLFCVEYMMYIEKSVYFNMPLYVYVQRQGSAMNQRNIKGRVSIKKCTEKLLSTYQELETEFWKQTRQLHINLLVEEYVYMVSTSDFCNRSSIQNKKRKELIGEVEQYKQLLHKKHKLLYSIIKYLPCSMKRVCFSLFRHKGLI